MWAIAFFLSFFFSWTELQLYARPLGTSIPFGITGIMDETIWFFFLFLQSRTKFSLSFPDRRATYVVEVLRPHLRHPGPIIIIKTLRSDWLGNNPLLLLDITNLNLHLDFIISLTGNNKSSSHLRLSRFDYWQSSLLGVSSLDYLVTWWFIINLECYN